MTEKNRTPNRPTEQITAERLATLGIPQLRKVARSIGAMEDGRAILEGLHRVIASELARAQEESDRLDAEAMESAS